MTRMALGTQSQSSCPVQVFSRILLTFWKPSLHLMLDYSFCVPFSTRNYGDCLKNNSCSQVFTWNRLWWFGITDIFFFFLNLSSLKIWDKNGSLVIYLIILKILRKYHVILSKYIDTFSLEFRAIQQPSFIVFVLSQSNVTEQVYVLIRKTYSSLMRQYICCSLSSTKSLMFLNGVRKGDQSKNHDFKMCHF